VKGIKSWQLVCLAIVLVATILPGTKPAQAQDINLFDEFLKQALNSGLRQDARIEYQGECYYILIGASDLVRQVVLDNREFVVSYEINTDNGNLDYQRATFKRPGPCPKDPPPGQPAQEPVPVTVPEVKPAQKAVEIKTVPVVVPTAVPSGSQFPAMGSGTVATAPIATQPWGGIFLGLIVVIILLVVLSSPFWAR
jgi:hypothetical protein